MPRNHSERRSHLRYPGQTLLLAVDGIVRALIDISTGGLSFEGEDFHRGQIVAVKFSSVLDEGDAVEAACRIVNTGGARVGAAFTLPNLPLLAYVIEHIGGVTGAMPHMVRKGAASLT
jgi:hypothetical protein